jgi:hypothetical protein
VLAVDVVETKSERLAREALEKHDADEETARSQAASQSRPISEQSFMQYMQLAGERCLIIPKCRESQSKNLDFHNVSVASHTHMFHRLPLSNFFGF